MIHIIFIKRSYQLYEKGYVTIKETRLSFQNASVRQTLNLTPMSQQVQLKWVHCWRLQHQLSQESLTQGWCVIFTLE